MFRRPLNYLILALTIAAIAGILVGTFGPVPASNIVHATTIEEDDPRWDCHKHGNRVCGDPGQVHAVEAWQAWDSLEGWTRLRVDPDREVRVDYVGTATSSPRLEVNEAAVPGEHGLWYVFRAVQSQ